ncbi:MAG: UDP-4-amino-4,6-dideoxy-N-acetyl-beta-L-altrosamine transaminase [Oceanospirillaceae bacterium]|nr:UDP-4-amino-4,6-dideoxy-N-acetyl-beta-L-altrosamine transaminase [Oceanospirillaceae bacterium]
MNLKKDFIPYGKQEITQQDIDAIIGVLQSDFITQGEKVPEFERLICDYTDANFAVAVNSATSALHIACLALGLRKGDWLWTSPISFVASANCGLYCGASVDFVDIDPDTYNISISALEAKLIIAKRVNKLPKIIVAVHLAGRSCEMQRIRQLSKEYGFFIIEDASHAIGAKYLGKSVGSCLYSDICVFSFHPVKIITTAEGGLATTNSSEIAEKMQLLRSHGITKNDAEMDDYHGPWYYQQHHLGFNYRLTDIQAALGISQLSRLDEYVSVRNRLVEIYNDLLAGLPIRLQKNSSDCYSSCHLYIIRLDLEQLSVSRRHVFELLRAANIGVNVHYIPIHTQPYYRELGFTDGDFSQAEQYYQEAISLPLFPALSIEQQYSIVDCLKKALRF